MGEFTKSVRNDEVPGPLRRSFTPEKWNRAFEAVNVPDDLDRNTHAAGLAIHRKLTAIRRVLKLSSSDAVSATTKLRAFVAGVNSDFFVTRDKTKAAIDRFQAEREGKDDAVYTLEEMAGLKLDLPGGFDWLPDEVVESLVDGIEIPIRVVMQGEPSLAGSPQMNKIEWGEVACELNYGILYRLTEDLWDDCLWNGYRIIESGRMQVFVPEDLDVLRAHRIGIARRASLAHGFAIMGREIQDDALAHGMQLRVRDVTGIERRGKRQVITVANRARPSDALQELSVQRTFATEPYYATLLGEPLDPFNGLTLSVVIDAWSVVSRVAQVLAESVELLRVRHVGDDRAHAWMPEYAPTLQVDALADVIASSLGITPADARRAVDFFTFRGSKGQEIWAQPLVPVGPGSVAPVFAAVISPNLRRLVDVWMRQAGIDLGKRGPVFEAHIRAVVGRALKDSRLLFKVGAYFPDDYTFKPAEGRGEQIDLIFSIGNTVFLAEAKCILEPTDPKGMAMHAKTVHGAAEQALRKANALESDRAGFLKDAAKVGMTLTEDFKVVPLVVVSTSTHVGVPALGVPVIDEYLLGRFLDGELEDRAIFPGDPTRNKVLKTRFYASADEAEQRAADYFAQPPQMKRFIEGVRARRVPLYPADENDWSGLQVTLECVAGGLPLALQDAAGSTIDVAPSTGAAAEGASD